MRADVVIPAYNEEERIAATIKALQHKWIRNVIVVDDGSSDKTYEIAKQYTRSVIKLPKNKGKMAAVFTGLSEVKADWVIVLDGDLGETASEAEKLLPPLYDNSADMTVATMPTFEKRGFGIVKKRAQQVLKKQTGTHLSAPLSGQRAFHKKWIPLIVSKEGYGFGLEMYLNLLILNHGGRIKEVPTSINHRTTGKTIKGFYHRTKQWIDMEMTIWNYS
ncbi:glycosyltransferase family 2 protein [Evansella cellulosilytica]|uniref:Glucosyl-3-phosphoglycerate synthase n=1 Tax=Evansella cellulosilytica (strain ATCC 21833 / DSM 2522 / FERM P-1141 / JCM 9156 / N-4) TaxID=649639 RepID=E6TXR3_EVAC2|nr:glycosyltransferase family 2 protein [Evansella cellulosilytica]ADU29989.1 glycosyl transferase family 2 [Evansella cellulosilytica DSM 2522]